jgi:uncharacterized protein YecT (DUF1311 family)
MVHASVRWNWRRVLKVSFLLPLILCSFTLTVHADDTLNCDDPQDQSSMTQCAGLDFEKADAELNAAWVDIKAAAVESDQAEGSGSKDNENALLASQRAWLSFRDAECAWQGFAARGGSMEPMLVSMCAAKLTRERIKQLQTGVSE